MNLLPRSPFPEAASSVVRRGFTLIELLVSTAVLALLLTLIVQIVQSVSRAARNGQEVAETYSSARAVLDTIGRDLDNALIRDDLAAFASASARDGTLAFYVRIPGLAPDGEPGSQVRRISLVRYDHDTNLTTLSRSDLSINWQQTNRISFGHTNNLPELPGVQPRRLCDGILGFDFMFLHSDGSLTRDPSTVDSPVRAVRLTLALVDPEASRLLTDAKLNQKFLALFAGKRPAPPASTKTVWSQALEDPGVWTGVPETARRRLKVFERFIMLPQS